MTPPAPGFRPSGERAPTRPPSESSGVRVPPPITADQAAELLAEVRGARAEVRDVKAEVARSEGRSLAVMNDMEKRLRTQKETQQMAEVSAELTITQRERDQARTAHEADSKAWAATKKLLARALTAAVGAAAIAFTAYLDRCQASKQVVDKVEIVAADTATKAAETKTAAVVDEQATTKALATKTAERLDRLEPAVQDIAAWIAEQRAAAAEAKPKKGRAK